jgi:hypothetical protein
MPKAGRQESRPPIFIGITAGRITTDYYYITTSHSPFAREQDTDDFYTYRHPYRCVELQTTRFRSRVGIDWQAADTALKRRRLRATTGYRY